MITVFVSETCTPCKQVADRIQEYKTEEPVALVDIDTDEGFDRFAREVLSKGDGEVPSAYKEGKRCAILLSDDDIYFDCSSPEPPVEPPGTD